MGERSVTIGQHALGATVTGDNNLTVVLIGVDQIPADLLDELKRGRKRPVDVPGARTLTANLAAKIARVFLGATATDVHLYRLGVRDTLQQNRIALFLQEDWEEGAVDVVSLCERRLREMSDAYIGVFGFRYGWVPPDHDKSITEMECFWALDRWPRDRPCPLFLFQPEAGSEADHYLKAQADAILQKEFPGAPEKLCESKQRQEAFLKRLSAEHRRITYFSNKHDLTERAWNAIRHWNCDILDAATPVSTVSNPARNPVIPPSVLGAIDNAPQRKELSRALKTLKAAPECPGACLLAHGERGMGQTEFLCFLGDWFREEWDGWKPRAQVHDLILPHGPWTPASLLRAIFTQLAPRQQAQGDLPAAVANLVLQRCADQPQVLRLSQVDAIEGGVDAFESEVWTPLFAALRAQRQPVVQKHSLVVIATADQKKLSAPAPNPNQDLGLALGRPVVLPALGPFDADAVCEWLRGACRAWIRTWLESSAIDGEPLGEEGRDRVTTMALAGGAQPSAVFENLAFIRLWSEPD